MTDAARAFALTLALTATTATAEAPVDSACLCIESSVVDRDDCFGSKNAVEACKTKVAANAGDLVARMSLCQALLDGGRKDDARSVLGDAEKQFRHDRFTLSLIRRAQSNVAECAAAAPPPTPELCPYEKTWCTDDIATERDLAACEKAIAVCPPAEFPQLYAAKGQVLLREQRARDAISALREAKRLDPAAFRRDDLLDAAVTQRKSLLDQCFRGQGDAALNACLDAQLVGEKDEFELVTRTGDLLLGLNRLVDAHRAYTTALEIRRDAGVTRQVAMLDQVDRCTGTTGADTIAACEQALRAVTGTGAAQPRIKAQLYRSLGTARLESGDAVRAIRDLRQALALDPNDRDTGYRLKTAELERQVLVNDCLRGEGQDGVKACEKALLPGDKDELDIRARLCRISFDADSARALTDCQAAVRSANSGADTKLRTELAGLVDQLTKPTEGVAADDQTCDRLKDSGPLDAALDACRRALDTSAAGVRAEALRSVIVALESGVKQKDACIAGIEAAQWETSKDTCHAAAATVPSADAAGLVAAIDLMERKIACAELARSGDAAAAISQCTPLNDVALSVAERTRLDGILSSIATGQAAPDRPKVYSNDPLLTGVSSIEGVAH